MLISACGLRCTECQFYNNPCLGCYKVEGKTFWAKDHLDDGICPLYNCSINDRNYNSCGDCKELPCKKFHDLKDPNVSEEKHSLMIKERIVNLKKTK